MKQWNVFSINKKIKKTVVVLYLLIKVSESKNKAKVELVDLKKVIELNAI